MTRQHVIAGSVTPLLSPTPLQIYHIVTALLNFVKCSVLVVIKKLEITMSCKAVNCKEILCVLFLNGAVN